MQQEDTVAMIHRLVSGIWNGEAEAEAPRVISARCPGLNGIGPEAVLAWHRDRRASFPDLHYSVGQVVAAPFEAAFRWVATGHQLGDFGPVPATGARVEYSGATFVRRDSHGLIDDVWSVNELFQLIQQLGGRVLPPE